MFETNGRLVASWTLLSTAYTAIRRCFFGSLLGIVLFSIFFLFRNGFCVTDSYLVIYILLDLLFNSNASDALDKLRYLSVTNPELSKDAPDLDIRIYADKENGIITLTYDLLVSDLNV